MEQVIFFHIHFLQIKRRARSIRPVEQGYYKMPVREPGYPGHNEVTLDPWLCVAGFRRFCLYRRRSEWLCSFPALLYITMFTCVRLCHTGGW